MPISPISRPSQVILEFYEGAKLSNGLPHGEGQAIFQNGCKYRGQFHHGRLHGVGRYEWPDGLVYEGEFDQGEISGTGKYTWPNGETYEGGVLMGLRHGEGRQSMQGGEVVYHGAWENGKRHGHGVIQYDSEGISYYEGKPPSSALSPVRTPPEHLSTKFSIDPKLDGNRLVRF